MILARTLVHHRKVRVAAPSRSRPVLVSQVAGWRGVRGLGGMEEAGEGVWGCALSCSRLLALFSGGFYLARSIILLPNVNSLVVESKSKTCQYWLQVLLVTFPVQGSTGFSIGCRGTV